MLIGLLITILVLGLVLYFIQMLPLQQPWKNIAFAVVVIIAIFSLLPYIPGAAVV
ncbi:hypothetical protein NLM27_43020 [Bradyrhizobium sp. CCGB12]|uniref:Thivi_2564 family membrane protein n=1 Tax=Bradyrhizobium sp. CCGB12 TaxID=2949632 RepID=UPI0020B34B7C|nr:Thivi_2564 family membrane protein [Bradyrhizobium sp. CCGB12]MCP3395473.1 hypothetical protein [Bradyrhizobium sp. CCGB12]